MSDPISIKVLLFIISALLGVLSFFMVKWINAVDALKELVRALTIEFERQKASCPVLHKEIERRFEKIERKVFKEK